MTLHSNLAATLAAAAISLLLPALTSHGDLIEVDDLDVQAPMQQAQIGLANDVAFDFDGPMPNEFVGRRWRNSDYSQQMLTSQVQQFLQTPRTPGMDTWAWRDIVENQLISLGNMAAPILRQQLASRDGYERDALQVALFRMENPRLHPNDLLQNWSDQCFNLHDADHPPYKFYRVLDIRDLVGLRELFPHHLFYIVEYPAKQARIVVAMAADGMVQSISDDSTLTRFIRNEAPPQITQVGKERVAAAATLLAAARTTNVYKPDRLNVEGMPPTFNITLDAPALHQTLTATFAPQGVLQTLSTGQKKIEAKPTPPVVVPTRVAPPPAMPD